MERYLVENCSPTLASLKTGNLFSYKYDSLEEVEFYVEFWNQCMAEKGVSVCISEDPKADGIDLRIQKKLS